MPVLRSLWPLLFVVALSDGGLSARQAAPVAKPSLHPSLVRIRIGHSAGMCRGGYCYTETIVEPGWVRSIRASAPDKKKFPDRTVTSRITKQEWEDLQHFIDAKVQAEFTGRVGCPACVDQPESWAQLEFSDGTSKTVSYDFSNPSRAIAALLKKIQALQTKLVPKEK